MPDAGKGQTKKYHSPAYRGGRVSALRYIVPDAQTVKTVQKQRALAVINAQQLFIIIIAHLKANDCRFHQGGGGANREKIVNFLRGVNDLLKPLIRFVSDRPGHDRRYAIDPEIRKNQQIRPGFRSAIGARSRQRRFFGKEKVGAIQRQITVNLVGRNLMEPLFK